MKKYLFLMAAAAAAASLFSGAPSVHAQASGYGCTYTAAGGAVQTACSRRTDCSDLVEPSGSLTCPGSACQPTAGCATTPSAGGGPSHPALPIPDPRINTNLPGFDPDALQAEGPVALVGGFYTFAFALAGFLAFVMLVYAGARYAFSAGNHSAQSDAKDAIKQALLGLGLLMGAYLILRTINSDLTTLRMPTIEPYVNPNPVEIVDSIFTCGQPGDGSCPAGGVCEQVAGVWACTGGATPGGSCPAADALTQLTPEAQAFESNSNRVTFSSTDPGVQQNLTKLQEEIAKLRAAITAVNPSARLTVNSAYRPLAYQQHLWEVCDRTNKLKNDVTPACAPLKLQVSSENSRHGLGGVSCVVSSPSPSAPHVRGVGVDMIIDGLTPAAGDVNAEAAAANQLLQQKHIDLKWQGIPQDPYHFNLQNPPH